MSLSNRVVVEDWKLLQEIGHSTWIGQAFAFVGADAAVRPKATWPSECKQRSETGPWVIPLVGQKEVPLAGVRVRGIDLPRLNLASVTTDKALYQEGRDEVHVFACDLAAPRSEEPLRIVANGAEFGRRIVELDDHGCAVFTLRDLPAGDYQLRWQEADDQDPHCDFTVAEYRLVPLVASVLERRVEGEPARLAMTLRLESFGVPVHGPVRMELIDRGIRAAQLQAEARRGVVECQFELTGEGPHVVNLQMVADPSQTATVPILGTRREERSPTMFSKLGPVFVGSLLPSDESQEVRGIHLERQGTESAPFRLDRVDEAIAHLEVKAEATSVCVATVHLHGAANGVSANVVYREKAIAGETIDIETSGPVALIAIGAFVEGRPWEGWAAVLHPSQLSPRINVPPSAAPNEDVDIGVEVEGVTDGVAYLVVKDARLLSTDSPANRLAGQIKRTVARSPIDGDEPQPLSRVRRFELGEEDFAYLLGSDTYGAMPASAPMATAAIAETAVFDEAGESASDEAEQQESVVSETEGEVVFAGLVPVRDHRADVRVSLGKAFAEYVVEAFVCAGLDWASREARFQVTKDAYADLQLPAFVHPQDGAWGQVHVGAASGQFRVELTRDGESVPLFRDGDRVEPAQLLEARRAQLTFLATPGEYRAVVEDLAGGGGRAAGRIDLPGKLRTTARSVRLLQPPERLLLAEDETYRSIRVLPGLDRPFRALVEATSGYVHLCCEQTAAKMLAASAMYAMAQEDRKRRDRAEAILIAGAEREREMWLRGRGLKMYPESANEPDTYWGPMAAHHLHYLDLLRNGAGNGLSRPLQSAVDLSCEIAEDVSRACDLDWPPERPRNGKEAYAAVRFGVDDSSQQRALDWVRQHTRNGQPPRPVEEGFLRGKVAFRAEAAYAAAALFGGGSPGDLRTALKLANDVVAQFGEEGRLYSTVDSVAAIALMAEMRAARIVGNTGKVIIDGQVLSTKEATSVDDASEIEAREGTVAVEVLRVIEDDWDRYAGQVPMRVTLERGGKAASSLTVGDAVDLAVKLTQGYSTGDLLWVCLPPALSRVIGGGQVKRFVVDFRGRDELRIPLVATSPTVDRAGQPAANRFGVCVRNMFEEERAGSPGLLEVTVKPR